MPTEIVKTYELKSTHPHKPDQMIVLCTGTVKTCAAFAATEAHRKDNTIDDAELDVLEHALRKNSKGMLRGVSYVIEPITEEYEADEED